MALAMTALFSLLPGAAIDGMASPAVHRGSRLGHGPARTGCDRRSALPSPPRRQGFCNRRACCGPAVTGSTVTRGHRDRPGSCRCRRRTPQRLPLPFPGDDPVRPCNGRPFALRLDDRNSGTARRTGERRTCNRHRSARLSSRQDSAYRNSVQFPCQGDRDARRTGTCHE